MMETYFKKYFWTVGVVVVIACAILSARAFNQYVEAKYLVERSQPNLPYVRFHAARRSHTARRSKNGDPLVQRDMFCSSCQPVAESAAPQGSTDPDQVPPTSLPLTLVATNIASSDLYSFATIRNTTSKNQGAYWIGDMIPDAGKVVRIGGRYVDFHNDQTQRVERISLLANGAQPHPVPSRPTPHRFVHPRNKLQAALANGIKKVNQNTYEVDRSLVEQVLANPAAIMHGARIVPSIRDGKPNGFKLYAIRPSSVYAKVGLMNGDTVNAVNGFDLTSPDKALEVYEKVREARNLSVQVTRRGKKVTLNYTIR